MEAAKRVPNQYFDYDTVPVDRERSEIRLIRLHLAGDDDPLICTMKSFDLNRCPSYDPFSYVWGSGKKTPIQCNGVRLDILPNLYHALKQYRSELENIGPAGEIGSEEEPENGHSGAKWIWADAMCIDQDNVEEKSWQIQLMRKIYEHGQTTWVWLGKDDKHTIEAFDLLYTLLDVRYKQEMTSDKRQFFEIPWEEREDLGFPSFMISSAYRSLSLLLRRGWYTRVWVIQELALSHDAVVNCGPSKLQWNQFNKAVEHASKMRLPIFNSSIQFQCIDEMEAFRTMRRTKKHKLCLQTLLVLARTRKATNEKDKIYALCGLADDVDEGDLDIIPDYSDNVSVEQVYRTVAETILRKTSRLDLLTIPRASRKSKLRLPTWVPDWSVSIGSQGFANILGLPEQAPTPYAATPPDIQPSIAFSEDMICLSGHVVDHIVAIGDKFTGGAMQGGLFLLWLVYIPRRQAVLNGWENICQLRFRRQYFFTREDMTDAYWQTLVAGIFQGGFRAAKQQYEEYDHMVRSKVRKVPSLLLNWLGPIAILPVLIPLLKNVLEFSKQVTQHSQDIQANQPSRLASTLTFHLNAAEGRRMFRTSKGYIGLAPVLAQKGDEIVLCKGGSVPFILRRQSVKGSKKCDLIGDCYVHGIMKGEAFVSEDCHEIWIH
jgi:Heterokaryon incompatibility protein (HET)